MADRKLTFLMEVELPPYCFLSEAVEWVAFGRVPQVLHHSDGSTDEAVDYRFYWREMPDNFRPTMEYPWFDPLEFESLGVPVDKKYFAAAEKCAFEFVDDLPNRIAEFESKEPAFVENEDGSTFDFWKKMANDSREKLLELGPLKEFVDAVEAGFTPHQEIACAKLFQCLAKGEIGSEAIDYDRWDQMVEDGEYEAAARFEAVPPEAYSLDFDWMGDEILIAGRKFVALRVKTADVLKNRSFLLHTGMAVTVERFGAFYMSGNASRSSPQAKRGRRTAVDWSLMKSHLTQLALSNELPDGKENCIYALIVFAEKELGRAPSRTTVQRNMATELDALYAQT
ncbi:hypothetical protein L0666_11020 [Octadecabacter sp. CECT 8868]|uniref:hypothetical protein n=1 Tax=Octadecabacter algicola TaxID=2909342 RepID=UPI001F22B9CC|nr:hypothetical protein [Octadecabacter algicola]MCF2905521.1 hypothetical protein [Octadecabacter algicola]